LRLGKATKRFTIGNATFFPPLGPFFPPSRCCKTNLTGSTGAIPFPFSSSGPDLRYMVYARPKMDDLHCFPAFHLSSGSLRSFPTCVSPSTVRRVRGRGLLYLFLPSSSVFSGPKRPLDEKQTWRPTLFSFPLGPFSLPAGPAKTCFTKERRTSFLFFLSKFSSLLIAFLGAPGYIADPSPQVPPFPFSLFFSFPAQQREGARSKQYYFFWGFTNLFSPHFVLPDRTINNVWDGRFKVSSED